MRLPHGAALALFALCAVAAVIAQLALLRSAFAPRRDVAPEKAVAVTSSRAAELVWAILPALVLVGTFAWAWGLMRPAPGAP